MLSSITQHFDLPQNKLYAERDRLIRTGKKISDLVSGNGSAQGIFFPEKILQKALARAVAKSKIYAPDPLGQPVAREAISRYYAAQGLQIPAEHLLITPGTSVSYWYAFKVLADFGDDILCPTPSYPLFDSIASLCGVKLVSYKLEEQARWTINFEHLESVITPRTKAIILISPHNPTGAVATKEEIQKLAEIAARRRLAIISDEVFSPFVFSQKSLPRPASALTPLVFTLNGLSKMLALPSLKIGWMAVTGEPLLVKKTMKALDMISDTFLPVNETAQFAVPDLLQKSNAFQTFYRKTIEERLQLATSLLSGKDFIQPEGGFFLALRTGKEEEEVALHFLRKHRLLVHPGYFYDMEGPHLVLSFVAKPPALRQALSIIERIL